MVYLFEFGNEFQGGLVIKSQSLRILWKIVSGGFSPMHMFVPRRPITVPTVHYTSMWRDSNFKAYIWGSFDVENQYCSLCEEIDFHAQESKSPFPPRRHISQLVWHYWIPIEPRHSRVFGPSLTENLNLLLTFFEGSQRPSWTFSILQLGRSTLDQQHDWVSWWLQRFFFGSLGHPNTQSTWMKVWCNSLADSFSHSLSALKWWRMCWYHAEASSFAFFARSLSDLPTNQPSNYQFW